MSIFPKQPTMKQSNEYAAKITAKKQRGTAGERLLQRAYDLLAPRVERRKEAR